MPDDICPFALPDLSDLNPCLPNLSSILQYCHAVTIDNTAVSKISISQSVLFFATATGTAKKYYNRVLADNAGPAKCWND